MILLLLSLLIELPQLHRLFRIEC